METNITKLESSLEKLMDLIVLTTPNIIVGILLIVAGKYFINFVLRVIRKRFEKRDVDHSIRAFIISILKAVMWAMLLLTAASTMGFQTTSFIAALSAFGLAVGMALQGSLSNFAGGVLILLFRPFEVDDYISSANGTSGTVKRIDILYTTLINDEGISIFSPNGPLANSVIKNYTKIVNRRFEYTIGIGYESNIKLAREAILNVLSADERILETPVPEVFVKDLGDSAVNLTIRAWTKKEDFWPANKALQETIKVELDRNNISIPFPQTEMHIVSNPGGGDKPEA